MYKASLEFLTKIYNTLLKSEVNISDELSRACDYLNLKNKTAEKVVKASITLTLSSTIISLSVLLVLFFNDSLNITYTFLILSFPVLVNHFYSNYYKDEYYKERVKDLGLLPDFFSLLISNLKINPNLENALMNVSRFDYGKASFEVKRLVNDVSIGKEWEVKKQFIKIMKGFNDSSVNSAVNSLTGSLSIRTKKKRNKLLSNSLNHLLKGMVDETKSFSQKVYTPILLLFGFGTIIPLIVISVIPVLGLMNNTSFNIYSIISFFAASIIIIKIVIDSLKKKSPSRFSQVMIKKEVKGLNLFLLFLLFIGLSSPTIVYFFTNLFPYDFEFLNGYKTLFAYISLSLVASAYYYSKTRSLIHEKNAAKDLENELIESFYILGSRINEGYSVESSLKYVGEVIGKSNAKQFFKKAYHKINNLGLSVEEAFSNAHLLKNVYSQRVKSLIDLFIVSVTKHSLSASENIIEICDYYTRIRSAEKEMKNSMSKNIDMIRLTIYLFTPVVCALIVNIQRLINKIVSGEALNFFSLSFSPLDIELTQLVISFYVFFLTIVLTNLYSFLTSNNEKISSRNNLFKSLVISCFVFTTTLIISRLLLFNL